MRRALVVVTVVVAAGCGAEPPPDTAEVAFELIDGAVVDASPEVFDRVKASFEGRPLVVNYWATWCEPCVVETPRFVEAAKRYAGSVVFVGVDVEDDAAAAERFLDEFGVPYPSLGDPAGDIKRDQRIVGLPTTQFFRADGRLAFVHSGEIDAAELTERIDELLRVGTPATPPTG